MNNYQFDPQLSSSPQSKELVRLDSPKQDKFLLKLGEYIAEGINPAYLEHCPEEIAIRDIVDYDAVNIDVSRFPLLKLYRQTDNHFDSKRSRETKAIIAYCLTFPQQDRLPGLMQYMSKAINIMLDSFAYKHEHCPENVILEDRNAEYRIMVNEATNSIYPFLRFNFTFRQD
jgi:hypothetical protein